MFLTTRVLTSAFTRMGTGEDISVVCCARSQRAVLCRQPKNRICSGNVPEFLRPRTVISSPPLWYNHCWSPQTYPGGAIGCRDRRMNSFLSITTKVLYYHGKTILGDLGIEGSKPGAAAVRVMMANRVTIHDCFSDIGSKAKKKSSLQIRGSPSSLWEPWKHYPS